MSLIAKFVCHGLERRTRSFNPDVGEESDGQYFSESITLSAIADSEGANKKWAHWTPCGELKMTIDNPPAQGKIQPGDVVFLTLMKEENYRSEEKRAAAIAEGCSYIEPINDKE